MRRVVLPSAAELALTCSSLCDPVETEEAYPALTGAWFPGALVFESDAAERVAGELAALARAEAAHEKLCAANLDRSGARAHARAVAALTGIAEAVRMGRAR